MLRNNLLIGIMLAVAILWWFMRRFRATMMVALAIPISLFVTFIALNAGGRTLNIISLAGLAFAVGMVLDAAIVVLENIVRLREKGVPSHVAAMTGASEVWGALVASTATTVAIFLPIVFLQDIAGQLFSDLAIAIAIAVVASLLIAVTVIPTAATSWLRDIKLTDPHESWWRRGTGMIMSLTDTPRRRAGWIVGLTSIAVGPHRLADPGHRLSARGQTEFHVRIYPAAAGCQRGRREDRVCGCGEPTHAAVSGRRCGTGPRELLSRFVRPLRVYGRPHQGSRRSRRDGRGAQPRSHARFPGYPGVRQSGLAVRSSRWRPLDRCEYPEPGHRGHACRRHHRHGSDLPRPCRAPACARSRASSWRSRSCV